MFTVSTAMAGNPLDFKPKGIVFTDNLKYMDGMETQERCVTGKERIDLKRRSRLATEKKTNWNERTDMTRKGPEKNAR